MPMIPKIIETGIHTQRHEILIMNINSAPKPPMCGFIKTNNNPITSKIAKVANTDERQPIIEWGVLVSD
jgi:hypothetical protein